MKFILSFILIVLGITAGNAQQLFISKGKIEFEKTINIYKQMEDEVDGDNQNTFMELFKTSLPKSKTYYFDMYFDADRSLYKPGKDDLPPVVNQWILGPGNENIVYKDLNKQESISRKGIYDNTFLIQDSLRKIEWKITNDTRTIAGFECRKATAIIMDSIYVVAFYTDQILTSSGPESFGGLQGMILGLAIPRLHTTWFATKVEVVNFKEQELAPPTKGKKITQSDLKEQLKKSLKDWGKEGTRNVWQSSI